MSCFAQVVARIVLARMVSRATAVFVVGLVRLITVVLGIVVFHMDYGSHGKCNVLVGFVS